MRPILKVVSGITVIAILGNALYFLGIALGAPTDLVNLVFIVDFFYIMLLLFYLSEYVDLYLFAYRVIGLYTRVRNHIVNSITSLWRGSESGNVVPAAPPENLRFLGYPRYRRISDDEFYEVLPPYEPRQDHVANLLRIFDPPCPLDGPPIEGNVPRVNSQTINGSNPSLFFGQSFLYIDDEETLVQETSFTNLGGLDVMDTEGISLVSDSLASERPEADLVPAAVVLP